MYVPLSRPRVECRDIPDQQSANAAPVPTPTHLMTSFFTPTHLRTGLPVTPPIASYGPS
jgi:hypothetical protein